MTFAELQTEFYARGFDYLNDSTAGQTRAKRWLNQSYLELCELYPWPFLEANTTGASPVTISDLGKVLSVVDGTNKSRLTYLDRRVLLDLSVDLTTTGNATYWYLEGSTTLKVYPVSSVSMTIRYLTVPAELSAAADSPVVPARFQDLIIDGAVIRAYKDDDEFDSAAKLRVEYDRQVLVMVNSLMNRHFDNGDRVIVRGGE